MSTDSAQDDLPSDSSTSTTDASTVAPQISLDEALDRLEQISAKQRELAALSEKLNRARETILALHGKEEDLENEVQSMMSILEDQCPRLLRLLQGRSMKVAATRVSVALQPTAASVEEEQAKEPKKALTLAQAVEVLGQLPPIFSLGNFRAKTNTMFPGHHSRKVVELLRDLVAQEGESKGPGTNYRRADVAAV